MPLSGKIKPDSHVMFSFSYDLDENADPSSIAKKDLEFTQMADDLLNEQNAGKVTLLVADTLQRFQLMAKDPTLSETAAEIKAREIWKTFLERHKQKIEELKQKKQLQIVYWDEYRLTPGFQEEYKKLALEKNKNFNQDVNNCVTNFTRKCKKELDAKHISYNEEDINNLMKNYLLEECAFQIVAGKDNSKAYQYEYYLTERNRAMRNVHNNHIKSKFTDRMREIHYVDKEPQQELNSASQAQTTNNFSFQVANNFSSPLLFSAQPLNNQHSFVIQPNLVDVTNALPLVYMLKSAVDAIGCKSEIEKQLKTIELMNKLAFYISNDWLPNQQHHAQEDRKSFYETETKQPSFSTNSIQEEQKQPRPLKPFS